MLSRISRDGYDALFVPCLTHCAAFFIVLHLTSPCPGGQVAHERSSVELQAVCTEVAGDCLPNVVVSLTSLLTCITQKHPYHFLQLGIVLFVRG